MRSAWSICFRSVPICGNLNEFYVAILLTQWSLWVWFVTWLLLALILPTHAGQWSSPKYSESGLWRLAVSEGGYTWIQSWKITERLRVTSVLVWPTSKTRRCKDRQFLNQPVDLETSDHEDMREQRRQLHDSRQKLWSLTMAAWLLVLRPGKTWWILVA